MNRLLGRGKRKKIEVVRTGKGVTTDKQGIADEFCMYFSSIVRDVSGYSDESLAHNIETAVEDEFHFKVAGKSFGGG